MKKIRKYFNPATTGDSNYTKSLSNSSSNSMGVHSM